MITAEIGKIHRFPSVNKLVRYAGLYPIVRQSGELELRGGISKTGSTSRRWILVQCANVAIRYDAYLKQFYRRLEQQTDQGILIIVTAQKLLVSMFHMLTREEVWNPLEFAS